MFAAAVLAGLIAPATAFVSIGAAVSARRVGTPAARPLLLRPALAGGKRPDVRCARWQTCQRARTKPCISMAALTAPGANKAAGSAKAVLCAAGGTVQAVDAGMQLLVSKILGYGILVGSLFLQVPQLIKILKLRSVAGISRWSRYSEVPINTSSCIYHFLIGAPLSTWGENIVVLTQNLVIVMLCWAWEKPGVAKREMILAVAALAMLSAAQLSLPPSLLPLLIWLNIPFILGSTVPQIIQNQQQGHTGQLAIATCFMKFGGCVVRMFTTVTQIGLDPGLLIGYGAGASMNLTLMLQGIIFREQTAKVLAAEKAQQDADRAEAEAYMYSDTPEK